MAKIKDFLATIGKIFSSIGGFFGKILSPLVKPTKKIYHIIRKTGKDGRFVFDLILIAIVIAITPNIFAFNSFGIILFWLFVVLDVILFVLRRFNIVNLSKQENLIGTISSYSVGLHLAVILFLSLFILPQYIGNTGNVIFYILLIFIETVVYLINVLVDFFEENPHFKPKESTTLVNIFGSILAIIIGLLFGLILMFIVSPDKAIPGFIAIVQGGFRDIKSIGNMIYFSVPLILTGLSVAFAFRTGLFNIGATGQVTMGAFAAVYIGVQWGFLADVHPLLHWFVAVLGAIVAGGIWGSIPGLLKAYRNVNEVVASIMLNYVAMYLNAMFIVNNIYNQAYARANDIQASAATPTFNLDKLFLNSSINGGIVVALLVVIVIHIVLNKTTFGFELKAVGLNRSASKYSGMNEKRNIVFSMVISGAISGLAGAMMYLVNGKHLKPDAILLPEGFTGIAISLLGLSSPIGVMLAGVFYGSLQQGGYYMQLQDFKPEIIDIIIAVIIYASALGLFLQSFVIKALKAREMRVDLAKNQEGGAK